MHDGDRSSRPRSCPDCGGELEPGFIPEFSHPNRAQQPGGHPGLPSHHDTFFGIEVGEYELKVEQSKLIPVITYRCSQCHLLRSYAG